MFYATYVGEYMLQWFTRILDFKKAQQLSEPCFFIIPIVQMKRHAREQVVLVAQLTSRGKKPVCHHNPPLSAHDL